VLKKTLSKQQALRFYQHPHDGSLFASGADGGLIIIFQGHGSSREIQISSQGTCDNITLALSIWLYFGGR